MILIREQAHRATWVDPERGESTPAGVFPNSGKRSFTPSLKSDDALLLLEAVKGGT